MMLMVLQGGFELSGSCHGGHSGSATCSGHVMHLGFQMGFPQHSRFAWTVPPLLNPLLPMIHTSLVRWCSLDFSSGNINQPFMKSLRGYRVNAIDQPAAMNLPYPTSSNSEAVKQEVSVGKSESSLKSRAWGRPSRQTK